MVKNFQVSYKHEGGENEVEFFETYDEALVFYRKHLEMNVLLRNEGNPYEFLTLAKVECVAL